MSRFNPKGLVGGALLVLAARAPVALTAWAPVALAASPAAAEETAPTVESRLEKLEKEVAELRQALAAQGATADQAARQELARRIDVLAAEIERLKVGEAAVVADQSAYGFGPAASKVYRKGSGLSVGGYGEVLYGRPDARRDDGQPSGEQAELTLERAVLYFGYKWNDHFLLNSELEVEDATSEEGEVEVELAYLDALLRPELNLRAGLVLIPMGFVNELHEPTVYLGARRPDVERFILPTTWREIGFGLFGSSGPLTYRAYLVDGLKAEGFAADGLREGRQEGAGALAEDFALVGRLDYVPVAGLLLGASAYAGDAGQGIESPEGRKLAVATRIVEGHAEWRWRGLQLRVLGARATVGDVAALDGALGLAATDSVGERLAGGYVEAGYDLFAARPHGEQSLTPYVRWERYDTQAAVPSGFARDPANDVRSLTLGLAYKPIDSIVLKVDYQDYDNRAGSGIDRLNVALGYIF